MAEINAATAVDIATLNANDAAQQAASEAFQGQVKEWVAETLWKEHKGICSRVEYNKEGVLYNLLYKWIGNKYPGLSDSMYEHFMVVGGAAMRSKLQEHRGNKKKDVVEELKSTSNEIRLCECDNVANLVLLFTFYAETEKTAKGEDDYPTYRKFDPAAVIAAYDARPPTADQYALIAQFLCVLVNAQMIQQAKEHRLFFKWTETSDIYTKYTPYDEAFALITLKNQYKCVGAMMEAKQANETVFLQTVDRATAKEVCPNYNR